MKKGYYRTKQLDAILTACKSFGESYFTVPQLLGILSEKDIHLGTATAYRQLKKLEDKGVLSSAKLANNPCISYRLIDPSESTTSYMQCEDCGKVIHFDCKEIMKAYNHLECDHNFSINPQKTILYGKCGCKKND